MIYLDTSLVVALITTEARTARAQDWLQTIQEQVVASEWTWTEVASALSIKQRTGQLDHAARARAERILDVIAGQGLGRLGVLTVDFRRATDLTGRAELELRGGDALHIAVAERLGATLHSLDEGQVAAARELGLDAVVTVERETPA